MSEYQTNYLNGDPSASDRSEGDHHRHSITTKSPAKMTEEEYQHHRSNYSGLCLACGDINEGGIEPDAEGYACEYCDEEAVEGIENALQKGLIEITEEA